MDTNEQALEERQSLDQIDELSDEPEISSHDSEAVTETEAPPAASAVAPPPDVDVRSLGIASVLYPANPPQPVNARLVRGVSFHDHVKKPRGLAGAAGLFDMVWTEPEDRQSGPDRRWS